MNRSLSFSGVKQAPLGLGEVSPAEDPWSHLDLLTAESPGLARWRGLAVDGRVIPSYVFIGPRGGHVPVRLALLAGIGSGEMLSTHAIVKLLLDLDLAPLLARDFALFGYPVANPHRSSGHFADFAGDFWKSASDPVIQYFEKELTANGLDGVLAVKANEPIAGFQIQVSSRVIACEVLWPVLELVQRLLPLASEPIQVFPQRPNDCHSLFSLGHARPGPFSLMIRTPKHMPVENQISAIVFSVEQILRHYRVLVSHANSL